MRKYFALIAVALVFASLPAMAARVTTIPIDHDPFIVYQAYVGDSCVGPNSDGEPAPVPCFRMQSAFIGNLGLDGDPIAAVPGVLSIVPGDNWSNYVSAPSGEYAIKSVRLRKIIPEFLQCSWVYNDLPDVLQRGSENIRLWWPLMYEPIGTQWILEIAWVAPGQIELYNETWTWEVGYEFDNWVALIKLFHELPWGTCEVPLISDESVFADMLTLTSTIDQAWPNDPIAALDAMLTLENLVIDNCIAVCPPSPLWTDELGRLGITNTTENPACCKLLVDLEAIAFDSGIFTPAQ